MALSKAKPRGLCLVAAALLAAAAAGCSVQRAGSGKAVTVAIRGGPADVKAAEDLKSAFEKRHPGISVKLEHIPDKRSYAKLLALMAGNSAPDVFGLTNGTILPHVAKGTILDLTPYLRKDPGFNAGDFFRKALDAYRFDGRLYAVPNNFHAFALYYNKDLFDRAGVAYPDQSWDWDDLVRAARKLTKDTNRDGRTDRYGIVFDTWLGAIAPWIWQNGGTIFDDETRPKSGTLSSPRSIEALQFLAGLKMKEKVAPGAAESTEQGVVELFYAGRAAMYPYLYVAGRMREYTTGFKWDCAPLPKGHTGVRASWAGTGCYCINKRTRVPEEAWKFVSFATSPEGMKIDARNGIAIPARQSVAYSRAFLRPDLPPVNKRVFLAALDYARLNPNLIDIPEYLTVFQESIDRLMLGESSAREIASVIDAWADEQLRAKSRAKDGVDKPRRSTYN